MLAERLHSRCPSSIFAGRAILKGHRLTFDKPSQDRSGKCTFIADKGANVEGTLWTVAPHELRDLDALEGVNHGYKRLLVTVNRDTGGEAEAQTYSATTRKPGIQPYDWYLALVIAGARQHGLSDEYVSALLRVAFQLDNDQKRPSRLQAIDVLKSAKSIGVLNELKASQSRS